MKRASTLLKVAKGERRRAIVYGAANCTRIVAGTRHLSIDALSKYFTNEHIHTLISRELEASAIGWTSTPAVARTPRTLRHRARRRH